MFLAAGAFFPLANTYSSHCIEAGTLTPASLSTVSPGTLRIRPTFEQQLSMSHRHAGTLAEDIHRDLSRSQRLCGT